MVAIPDDEVCSGLGVSTAATSAGAYSMRMCRGITSRKCRVGQMNDKGAVSISSKGCCVEISGTGAVRGFSSLSVRGCGLSVAPVLGTANVIVASLGNSRKLGGIIGCPKCKTRFEARKSKALAICKILATASDSANMACTIKKRRVGKLCCDPT